MEIPELDYKLRDGSGDSFNNRRLRNLVVKDVSVSEEYIAWPVLISGHEWILIFFFQPF